MSNSIFGQAVDIVSENGDAASEFDDKSIRCIDCAQDFVWSTGEQIFFRDKKLQNPPKRCKSCKKLKNERLAAVEAAQTTGVRHRIEIVAECARCSAVTTVPFYPSQGRPVYCRACYIQNNAIAPNGIS
ncbi:MAG: zinc-ribbon domain containing protein [Acidobacteriota bacterium]